MRIHSVKFISVILTLNTLSFYTCVFKFLLESELLAEFPTHFLDVEERSVAALSLSVAKKYAERIPSFMTIGLREQLLRSLCLELVSLSSLQ